MADHDELKALLNEAPEAPEPAPAPEPAAEATPEPEAPAEAATEAETGEQDAAPPAAQESEQRAVPLTALLDERDKRKALEARLAQLEAQQRPQRQVQPPDPVTDPDAYHRFMQQVAQRQQQTAAELAWNTKLDMSEVYARDRFGDEVVDKARDAFMAEVQRAPHLAAELQQARDPYRFVVDWHKRQALVSEIGNDPEAWKEAERKRIEAEVMAKLKAAPPAAPPSLAGETSIRGQAAPVQASESLKDLLGER